jgi:hypothetical protein
MKIWKEGDPSTALCPSCERIRDVAFRRRAVEMDPGVSIPDVLVAVCCDCDGIAMIPAQSSPRLRAGFKRATVTVNARVPRHLEDVLLLLADEGSRSQPSTSAVVRFLLSEFASDSALALRVRAALGDDLLDAPGDHELSIRVPAELVVRVDEAASRVGIESRTAVVKGLLAVAKEDVLDGRNEVLGNTMRRVLAAVT